MTEEDRQKKIKRIARCFTTKGIETMIAGNKRNLADLQMLEDELGEAGREYRRNAMKAYREKLSINEAALELRLLKGGA